MLIPPKPSAFVSIMCYAIGTNINLVVIVLSLFGSKEKQELEKLRNENAYLRAKVPNEQFSLDAVNRELQEARITLARLQNAVRESGKTLQALNGQIIETNETIMLQSFGLYTPQYAFKNADEYKFRLSEIRERQKEMIKGNTAVSGSATWTVNGNVAMGRKMVADMQKLLLRAFNSECDDIIEHVRYSNIEASQKRITSSRDAISKLGEMMGIQIMPYYYQLKTDELHLAFEYQQKKQTEKDAQREARARMREEAKLLKEIEAARLRLEKEQKHYENALRSVVAQIACASPDKREALEEKRKQLENQLSTIDKEFRKVDYRSANQRAGYVYIISNIGAFGENVYKIGMTRRLDPMERVDELGDASVPFDFDVHAMIFSDDAPKLEAALHNAFADRKLNFVNQRREFFNVTLAEIKDVVRKNFDKSVEFIEVAPAEQYRQSVLMRKSATNSSIRP